MTVLLFNVMELYQLYSLISSRSSEFRMEYISALGYVFWSLSRRQASAGLKLLQSSFVHPSIAGIAYCRASPRIVFLQCIAHNFDVKIPPGLFNFSDIIPVVRVERRIPFRVMTCESRIRIFQNGHFLRRGIF